MINYSFRLALNVTICSRLSSIGEQAANHCGELLPLRIERWSEFIYIETQ